jgi:tetratricopeptide (TPR) repeat protein
MSRDTDQFDFFVSYARADNKSGWVTRFVEELLAEHAKFAAGRTLCEFFDRRSIGPGADWEQTLHQGIARSRLFLAFISPHYFASEWCRREWRAWIDAEIAKHILTEGVRPIYLVEVPGFSGKGALSEQEVARKVAELCGLSAPYESFLESAAPVVKQVRRRQLLAAFAKPFADEGLDALRRDDLHRVLAALAQDLDRQAQRVADAANSESTVPPYNRKFSGRLDELLELRKRLTDDQAGVVCGVHGLGGIGKTELAFTYAHAFASAYPGGRFLIPCEGRTSLRDAVLCLGDFHEIRPRIADEERKTPEALFAAVARCLDERLAAKGHVLLVLDNVTDTALVGSQQTDCLTALGPKLHLLATTRLLPPAGGNWLTLGELPEADALALLEKHRAFAGDPEREAARQIVKRLGGFALAVELVAAGLAAHEGSNYVQFADGLGLDDLETMAGDRDIELRRHNHERRLSAVLGPVLRDVDAVSRRVLEYAAHLPPDHVVLPWLRALVEADFPEALRPTRLVADPWKEIWQRLLRLSLFSRIEQETSEQRIVRLHRLVQELVRRDMAADQLLARQRSLDALVRARDAALAATTRWTDARWELEPLDALASLRADTGHPEAASLLQQTSVHWHALAAWNRAEPLLRRALAIEERVHGPNHPRFARALDSLGVLLHQTNRLPEAEACMRRALSIEKASFGPDHPSVATTLNSLALLLEDTNRIAEAELRIRWALAIDEKCFGPNDSAVARDLRTLAQLLQDASRLSEAEPLMHRALAITEHNLGPEHQTVAHDLNNLAALFAVTKRPAEAEAYMRRALVIFEHHFGADHPKVASVLNNLAYLLLDGDRHAEAEPLMRRALEIDEGVYGATHPAVARDLNNLAQLLQDTGRHEEAEPLMRRHLQIYIEFSRATRHGHPQLKTAFANYTALLEAMGRSKQEIRAILRDLAPEFFEK